MIFNKKALKQIGKTITKGGYIKDLTTNKIEVTVYNKKVKQSKAIGFIKNRFITDIGELTVLNNLLKWNHNK